MFLNELFESKLYPGSKKYVEWQDRSDLHNIFNILSDYRIRFGVWLSNFNIQDSEIGLLIKEEDELLLHERLTNYLEQNKKTFITDILKDLRDNIGSEVSDQNMANIIYSIKTLRKYVDWPELDLIEKSLRKELHRVSILTGFPPIQESIYPSDIELTDFQAKCLACLSTFIFPYHMQDRFEKWIGLNFNVYSERRNVVPWVVSYSAAPDDLQDLPVKFHNYCEQNKKQIITAALNQLRDHHDVIELLAEALVCIKKFGNLNWPEINTIMKSIELVPNSMWLADRIVNDGEQNVS